MELNTLGNNILVELRNYIAIAIYIRNKIYEKM